MGATWPEQPNYVGQKLNAPSMGLFSPPYGGFVSKAF